MSEDEFDPLDGPATIPAQLAASAEAFGDAIYLVGEDGQRLSFRETQVQAERAARAFLASGLGLGDRVAIWAPKSVEWVIACLGLQIAGGVLVPLNTRFKAEEAGYILERSGAKFLCVARHFLGNDYVGMLQSVYGSMSGSCRFPGLPGLAVVVAIDDTAEWTSFLQAGDPVSGIALGQRIGEIGPDSLADILFTSGTTGNPKGAMHGHRQALGAVRSFNFVNGFQRDDRMAIVNPFFHSFGYRAGWVACLIAGMTACPVAMLDVRAFIDLIEREAISVLPGPPTLFQTILDLSDRRALPTVRLGITGAANIDPEMIRRSREELGIATMLTSYGLTEATAMGTSCRVGDDIDTIAGTVGRSFPGWKMRLVAPDGTFAKSGAAGEIQFSGFNVMQGYFDDPGATAAAIDADGWLHTGDIGTLDDCGYLKIIDRLKDIVIVDGFNVYPAEIEGMIRRAPGVAEVAVVGRPDARLGEVCVAFVVPSRGQSDLDALADWCGIYMANYKVPRRFVMIDALPKTPLGKVQRFLLRQWAET